MKIRNGYVSNSSSSSFLVYGKYLDYHEAMEEFESGNRRIRCILRNRGTSGDCADYVFLLSKKRLKLLDEHQIDITDAMFVDVEKWLWFNDDGVVDIDEPLSGGSLISIQQDDSSPYDNMKDGDSKFVEWCELQDRRRNW